VGGHRPFGIVVLAAHHPESPSTGLKPRIPQARERWKALPAISPPRTANANAETTRRKIVIGVTSQAGSATGVIEPLAPAFAAGFAVQQLLELADPVLDKIPKDWKKPVPSLIALAIGLALAIGAHLHVLAPLGGERR
jgi:hypothetical protein